MNIRINWTLLIIIVLAALLRFWNLGGNPPSLYWDEASLGYNAYSIATTGRDEHGEFLPISRFIAFGDYKPPGYIYATVPFIWLFGLNEFSIRFASALAGTLTVLVAYFLVKQIFDEKKWYIEIANKKMSIALITSFLLAVSPWHLQFSRGAFEANLATFFSALGICLFLYFKEHRMLIIPSMVSFALSIYTFNTHRVFVPLLVITLILLNLKTVKKNLSFVVISLLLSAVLLSPMIPFMSSREGRLRFEEVTFLNDLEPIEIANQRIERENNSLITRIIHNRRVQFTREFLKHLSDHFTTSFLFFIGDVNPRLGTQENGTMYVIELPLLLCGIYFLVKKQPRTFAFLSAWYILGLLPASLARETPHALRTMNILPVPQILVAAGIVGVVQFTKWKSFANILLIVFYTLSIASYLHTYHVHYPKEFAASWQYGYKQLVQYIKEREEGYDKIYITRSYGRPYIYFLLYEKYPLDEYLKTRYAERDWFGFWTVNGFGKYRFGDIPPLQERGNEAWLLVSAPNGMPSESNYLSTIRFPNSETAFEIADSK